jgi:formate dehydrogenase
MTRVYIFTAIVRALESGHLGGYAGDVWYPQPAPSDHPWPRCRGTA